jgi:hypothetical protein
MLVRSLDLEILERASIWRGQRYKPTTWQERNPGLPRFLKRKGYGAQDI